jgi:anti-sigma factor RsiW
MRRYNRVGVLQAMNCREFKSNHVGFVDDLLSAADMSAMRRHLQACKACATLDIRIRRSLLIVRNLPQIEPSADFFARLTEALKQSPAPARTSRPVLTAAAVTVATAALAAAVYFAIAFLPGQRPEIPAPPPTTAVAMPLAPVPMSEVTIAAAVPAGVPVWPAMFMVGELPARLVNAELLDSAPASRKNSSP